MIIEDLKEMNRRLCYDLCNVSFLGNDITGLSPRLIFPEKRKKKTNPKDKKNSEMRISEQESRILFCNMLIITTIIIPLKHLPGKDIS